VMRKIQSRSAMLRSPQRNARATATGFRRLQNRLRRPARSPKFGR